MLFLNLIQFYSTQTGFSDYSEISIWSLIIEIYLMLKFRNCANEEERDNLSVVPIELSLKKNPRNVSHKSTISRVYHILHRSCVYLIYFLKSLNRTPSHYLLLV